MHALIPKSILFLLVLTPALIVAQLDDEAFSETIQHEELEILSEDFNISFVGQKAEFIEVVFEKKVEYRILGDPATLFPFELPEKIDPTYDPRGSRIKNRSRVYDDVTIHSFEVSVIKPDGTVIQPMINRKQKETRIVTDRDMFGVLYSWIYDAEGIERGDRVKIQYKYSMRYGFNLFKMFAFRMFLHGEYPRHHYNLTLSHHQDLEVDTFFMNGCRPVTKYLESQVIYQWELHNLPGCLDEPGNRPYTDLPWFTFTVKPYELLYQDFNSFRETFVPMWYYMSANRESRLRSAVVDASVGAKDRDNLAFDKLAQKYVEMGKDDTTGIERLRYFQRYMVDSVSYQNDSSYYAGDEPYLNDHPGIQLKGQKVRDHLTEFVYASMIPKMDLQYFTAYAADSRSGAMSLEYYAPVYDNELLFAPVLKNNTLAYILPKTDIRNLYCEELPFYYEGVPVILIYTYDFAGYKRNFNELARIVNTPGSSHTDNYRKVNSMAKVNPDDLTVTFQSKIQLSGQFSTLTRNLYGPLPVDSTVNPRYLRKIWETGSDINAIVENVKLNETNYYFPFKTSVDATYRLDGLVHDHDNKLVLDVGTLLCHVIYENFNAMGRQSDFFPDFVGSDTYACMVEFSRDIDVISPPENISLDNEFGIFKFSTQQAGPNKILISSYFLIKQPYIEHSKTSAVEKIFKAIEKAESCQLTVTMKE